MGRYVYVKEAEDGDSVVKSPFCPFLYFVLFCEK